MTIAKLLTLAGLALALAPAAALAQAAAPAATPAKPDPYKSFLPDPSHIPFILPENIPWQGTGGNNQRYNILGNPNEPGPYIQLLKWYPGAYSKPHLHDKVRYITVLSGTWWVSSSNVYDPTKTYPLPAGSIVRDEAGTVHWDGAKDVPTILLISGEGPAPNIAVDETGKRVPRVPAAAAGAAAPPRQ